MFLYTLKFNIEAQEAKLLEKFFSRNKLKTVKEEREEKLHQDKINLISNTEKQEDEPEKGPENRIENIRLVQTSQSTTELDRPGSPSLPLTCTQIRVSGQKRKSQNNNTFKYY